MEPDDAIAQLTQRLEHYPPDRYPVQHATTQFHLAQAFLQSGRTDAATAALRASLRWFPEPMAVERAKVINLAGAAARAAGDLDAAAAAFTQAAEVFAEQGQHAEQGAALFNLGLVLRDNADAQGAVQCFLQAQGLFDDQPVTWQAAVAIHLGKALLEAGDAEAAATTLQRAVELSERVGDREGLGAAANGLGLAHLACDRPADAVEVLRLAVAAHPRALRPAEFAMAKANLALGYEDLGAAPRARLAARQALAAPAVPAAVQRQGQALLDRLPAGDDSDLLATLDEEPEDQWAPTVRDELVRWAALSAPQRREEAAIWIRGLHRRTTRREQLIHSWLSALIEMPPGDLDAVVTAALEAADDVDIAAAQDFRAVVERVTAWFPVPQLLRLTDRFAVLGAALGREATWNQRRT